MERFQFVAYDYGEDRPKQQRGCGVDVSNRNGGTNDGEMRIQINYESEGN